MLINHLAAKKFLPLALFLEQALAAEQPFRDSKRLTLRTRSRGVRRQVARGRDEHVGGGFAPPEVRILPDRGLETLNGMEVTILAQQRAAERGDQRAILAARGEMLRHQRRDLVYLLLMVEQPGKHGERFGGRTRPT